MLIFSKRTVLLNIQFQRTELVQAKSAFKTIYTTPFCEVIGTLKSVYIYTSQFCVLKSIDYFDETEKVC